MFIIMTLLIYELLLMQSFLNDFYKSEVVMVSEQLIVISALVMSTNDQCTATPAYLSEIRHNCRFESLMVSKQISRWIYLQVRQQTEQTQDLTWEIIYNEGESTRGEILLSINLNCKCIQVLCVAKTQKQLNCINNSNQKL